MLVRLQETADTNSMNLCSFPPSWFVTCFEQW